ncbi:MAG: winged helix-turn-helix domain-containing protein [Candidatus Gastranaerophilales bacterium]|nr:winged helix-turn-helix domain-containing protein [Candidatus Gastranaerophilales bacterium]
MMEMIGEAAGKIWNYLNENGESSLSKMKKDLDLKGNFAELGLGWLAREGKVEMSKKGISTNVKLV